MDASRPENHPAADNAHHLLSLAEAALYCRDIAELADIFLKTVLRLTEAPAALLYVSDERPASSCLFHAGLLTDTALPDKSACEAQFKLLAQTDLPAGPLPPGQGLLPQFILYPIKRQERPCGFLGLAQNEASRSAQEAMLLQVLALLGHALNNLLERLDCEKQINNLNAYLSVSTMIAQALDLRDVLEAVLYFCMDRVAAEAASVLLLDFAKENFRFYSAEGPAKPVLLTASFPADQGLAGAVLATQQAEVINEVQADPRFYSKFDDDSGFTTRNMIAIPLTAGAEKIGVLEIINKIDGPFTDDDLLFLQTIAEEIAFAIRNAKLFEVVVKSYCKQRQGLNTCKGCKRPLGSWTPCVRYREETAGLEV
ncbi:MAG: GAF domain-containing protein [Deltaproteobacteria bacterium]|nr:GAF domain-containing protein [Deltaproteobacteria bacterium]